MQKKKGPVPTLIFFNEEAEHVFDCDISIIPGAIGKIRDKTTIIPKIKVL